MKRKMILLVTMVALAGVVTLLFRAPIGAWLKSSADGAPTEAVQGHAGHAGQPSAASKQGERKVLYWYDPMNPAHRTDKPGKASDGMDLVPMYADTNESNENLPPGSVMISPQKQQLIGVRTATVERQHVQREIRAVGRVTFDETKVSHIHTKVTGYIEDVFVDFVGKAVKKGDPLFTIYSPELVSTQQEYLIAVKGKKYLSDSPYAEVSSSAESLVHAARERLRLWDVSDDEVKVLEKEGKVKRTLTMYSPATGIVTERAVFPQGRYVNPEMDLYTIVDLSTAWVLADIYEYEVPYVKVGQTATMHLSYFPGKSYVGRVTFINPTVDPKTRTAKVRLELPNPQLELKPEMFTDVELAIDYGTQIVVPQEAVLDSGTEQVVFVAHGEGYFEPRKIQAGARVGDQVVVLDGLRPGETIVTSGNFLIDSESRLKSAMAGMKH